MNSAHFDHWTRGLMRASSRRHVLRGFTGVVLGLMASSLASVLAAKKKHQHKKRKKPKLNAYGCVDVGQPCRGRDSYCCSGICNGKKPKKGKKDTSRCVAHDTGRCPAGWDPCNNVIHTCTTSLGLTGNCWTTTGYAGYCGYDGGCPTIDPCRRDADCHEKWGPRAACVLCTDCLEGTMCMKPD